MTLLPRPRLCIVADTSDSALAHWKMIRQTALRLYRLLEARFAIDLYLLGERQPRGLDWFEQQRQVGPSFPGRIACSLITPTMRALLKSTSKHMHAIVMVGNGAIVDVTDWLDESRVEHWLAVQAGPDPVCSDPSVTTWPHAQIDDIIVSINSPYVRQRLRGSSIGPRSYRMPSVRWALDTTGYPLVQVDTLGGAYVHLFPIAKAQFEHYLAQPDVPLGDSWYETILHNHPRGQVRAVGDALPGNLFMTGLLPDELARFVSWMGHTYRLMTVDEWATCYTWLTALSLVPEPPVALATSIDRYAAQLWSALCQHARSDTFETVAIGQSCLLEVAADSSYARPNGVRWMGQSGLLQATTGVRPANANVRKYNVGFRLITTGVP